MVEPPRLDEPTIVAEHLSKWYGDVVAVSDVSFQLGPGVTGLLGPNGAGKSSILKMLAGLLAPSTGTIRVLGRAVRADPAIYRRIGLVPEQEVVYPYLTGREFVTLNAALQGVPRPEAAVAAALALVDLTGDADRRIGGYSKGMRQRIKIAGGLVHDPDILILDEPLTGTDPVQRLHLIELIRRQGDAGKTVIVSSHVLHEIERLAGRILVLVDGKLAAAGDYRAIRDQIDERARVVRVRADDIRGLASGLVVEGWVETVRFDGDGGAVVETSDVRALYRLLPALARARAIRLYEITALDESLASVFAYVTER